MTLPVKDNQESQISILDIKIDPIGMEKLHSIIKEIINTHQKAVIANVNVYAINLAYENYWFREFLNNSQIVFCDGFGVLLGARVLGFKIPERITYADWMWKLAEFSEAQNFSLFFVGSKEAVAEKAALRLQSRFPNLRIAGVRNGFFDNKQGSAESERIIREINSTNPNILILGLGMPLQERWLMENWDRIDANIALPGGAVFDYLSGELKRGPKILTNHGFEWLARLIIEPRRLWKRYLIGNPLFLLRILKQRIKMLKTYGK